MNAELAEARAILAEARSIVALTGAGVSAESGVPTFRGADGLWRSYNTFELATPEAFARDPKLVWEFYDWRRTLVAPCGPNPAHRALAEREARSEDFTLVTQNVDGLHALAGSKRILEVHGSLWRIRCSACGLRRDERTAPLADLPPRCAACGGLERPDVVWFGETLDGVVLEAVCEALERADAALVIGTSGVVYPAAAFAGMARDAG
ncbi:MAG: NAD-dependent deacylase, partial [Candidatus Methylomirabilis sp.]|nr:NAD-dependent deacylase [Deltaproteobacteria bacterium]